MLHLCLEMGAQETTFGGYLALDDRAERSPLDRTGVCLGTGRACIAAASKAVSPKRVWVPHYICDTALQGLEAEGVAVARYPLNDKLLPSDLPDPSPDAMLLVVDYFGLLGAEAEAVVENWGGRGILDRSQAFFAGPAAGCWTFTSFRKFFGVPDGAQLWGPGKIELPTTRNEAPMLDHLVLAQAGEQGAGLEYHRKNEALMSVDYRGCAWISEVLMERTDRQAARRRRTANFQRLHELLGAHNELQLAWDLADGPYAYPFLPKQELDLARLHERGIHAPRLWPELLERNGLPRWEQHLVEQLKPLPVDQRYTPDGMVQMAERILHMLGA